MDIISNFFNFFYQKIQYFYTVNVNENKPKINNNINDDIIYVFINTANIYNASEMMFNNLQNNIDKYNNKYIRIYLLKSHKLEPLFKDLYLLKINDENLSYIKYELSKKRRHLHTFIDAIDSFIEYNKIKNYQIYY
jgi:hypothetical protein